MAKSVTARIDGASRGNPGPAGVGIIVRNEGGETVDKISEYLGGNMTNNQAEYSALIKCLEYCKELGVEKVEILSDSTLIVNQMKGSYSVKSENIKGLYVKAKELESKFQKVTYKHISRDENLIADNLANQAIDREQS